MPFVQRDSGGSIIGLYSLLQPGYATEFQIGRAHV